MSGTNKNSYDIRNELIKPVPDEDNLSTSSSENLDNLCMDHDLDLDEVVGPRKPHFLDLNAIPPPDFDENLVVVAGPIMKSSSNQKILATEILVDKKFERDGEISDYEFAAASGHTKKEISITVDSAEQKSIEANIAFERKKKHFLDENPIAPDYLVINKTLKLNENRENRSLDRNFERQDMESSSKSERKHSLDRESRSRRTKEPSYTLSRFIESDLQADTHHGTWPSADRNELHLNYNSMPNENVTQNLGPKVECIYSLLSMLGSHDSNEMSRKFLDLSKTPETCTTLRRSGCIPLLVQMMHSTDSEDQVKRRAAQALHNVVHCHPDDKTGRREAKVLRLIEQIMDYCNFLKMLLRSGGEAIADDADRHPLPAISSLMKVSFDEEHRHAMCQLGALQAIASLVHLDHAAHGPKPEDQCCNSLRRYALMALTNLTFGDGNNKALLCANKDFMEALVAQLDSAPDDLLQVTASVLRNLSWRADSNMKSVLTEIGTVTALAVAAMRNNKNENTLKAILSALWNLSAHCSTNKAEFCSVNGTLGFLVDMLTYEGPSKTLKIIENAGGILRNVSSHIAVREDYRKILRERNCLGILLQQLKSESLTVVSNACGTLWNLSARSPEDQKFLWDNGAVPMLRSLIHSKHKMISEGSSAALKNLLNFRPGSLNQANLDPIAKSMNLKELPTLNVRKQKALENELNSNLAETCENLDVVTPPKENKDFILSSELKHSAVRLTRSAMVSKSESRESIVSAKSDSVYEKLRRGNSAPPIKNSSNTQQSKSLNFNEGENDKDDNQILDELPIDYSAKYNEDLVPGEPNKKEIEEKAPNDTKNENFPTTYQETDLDQPTNFSLRYAENQNSDTEVEKPQVDDTIKCYQTEDTPYVISNSGSVTDLGNSKQEELNSQQVLKKQKQPQKLNFKNKHKANLKERSAVYGTGTCTPDNPISYCEEGTPGYFSRYESLSSLDESPPQNSSVINTAINKSKLHSEPVKEVKENNEEIIEKKIIQNPELPKQIPTKTVLKTQDNLSLPSHSQNKTNANSAQETPLMFSRRSSMDSLAAEEVEEPFLADDKSSIVSDFSRLASGVISPSDLPDSPTQSMPQSPKQIRTASEINFPAPSQFVTTQNSQQSNSQQSNSRLRSVFEDEYSTFQVENTPAQFSTATSLSNLTIDDDEDEPKIATDSLDKEIDLFDNCILLNPILDIKKKNENMTEMQDLKRQSVGFSENEEEDDDLLAAAINIGINRNNKTQSALIKNSMILGSNVPSTSFECKETNSAIAISDLSSNTSECADDLLEQCIKDGMMTKSGALKCNVSKKIDNLKNNEHFTVTRDPIAMLRRGGQLPQYLPVKDEVNKFLVEDSPCSFSVVSALSALTIEDEIMPEFAVKLNKNIEQKTKNQDDSLSSISIESEDDSNLLSQAIAAGCNRPKSSLGHNFGISVKKPNPQLLSAAPTLDSPQIDATDSLSSVDSSDNDQSKSLLEQCIQTGMAKKIKTRNLNQSSQQSSNQRLSSQMPTASHQRLNPMLLDREVEQRVAHIQTERDPQQRGIPLQRYRDRDRKDEQLLKECINFGIPRKADSSPTHIRQPSRHLRQVLQPTEFNQRLMTNTNQHQPLAQQQPSSQYKSIPKSSDSKNGVPTSAVVLGQHHHQEDIILKSATSTAPDVGMLRESPDGTANHNSVNSNNTDLKSPPETINQIRTIGSEGTTFKTTKKSLTDLIENYANNNNVLEQSNEYPATLNVNDLIDTLSPNKNSTFDMEMSNEFLIEENCVVSQKNISQNITQYKNLNLELDLDLRSPEINFNIDNTKDKQKNPDLMLKSVERLTLELVSTAEYLRTNSSKQPIIVNTAMITYDDEDEKSSEKDSNKTWNENTCPDDVSFPSVSVTAPMVASFTIDDESMSHSSVPPNGPDITPTNEQAGELTSFNYIPSQPNSLDSNISVTDNKSEKLNIPYSSIQFIVGGEVKQTDLNLPTGFNSGLFSFDLSSNTMSQSTIIAMEAHKLANNLLMADSATSLDLDQIRPPSCMESMSGYFDNGCRSIGGASSVPHSPQLSRLRKKSLPHGLMAKRALGCAPQSSNYHGGSMESIASNLDNVKPPSIMDDLLDSMISVASITSEIVEPLTFCAGSRTIGLSNYETAFEDEDATENTVTLHSCMEILPLDDYSGTPIPSDFSSAESTPRKSNNKMNSSASSSHYMLALSSSGGMNSVRKLLTPKQRRRFIKDRYKTYTVAADFVLKESFSGTDIPGDDNDADEEILKVEIEDNTLNISQGSEKERYKTQVIDKEHIEMAKSESRSPSSVRRRYLNPDRFKTRTIIYNNEDDVTNETHVTNTSSCVNNGEFSSLTSTEDDSDEVSSIRAMTKNFKYITYPDEESKLQHQQNLISLAAIKNQYLRSKLLEGEPQQQKIQNSQNTVQSVIESDDYNSLEFCDQNSETESCDQNAARATTTDDDDDVQSSKTVKSQTPPKPRIIKPTDKDSGTDLNFSEDAMTPPESNGCIPKPIRGRKKAAYVSPYKKSILSGSSTRTTSPKSQIGNTIIRNNNAAAKNTELRKNFTSNAKSNLVNKVPVAKSQYILVNKTNIGNKLKTGLTKPGFATDNDKKKNQFGAKKLGLETKKQTERGNGIERQGTFVKDEPCNTEVPVVGSYPTSPTKVSKLPTRSSNIPKSPAKVNSQISLSKLTNTIQKSASMGTNTKLKFSINNTSRTNSNASTPQSSNAPPLPQIVGEQPKRKSLIGVRKCPSVPSVSQQRSNSNANIRQTPRSSTEHLSSTQPPSRSNSTLTSQKINQISSRIAGIWKRIDEAKNSNNNTNSNKIAKTIVNPCTSGDTKPPSGSQKLIRSSTFDNSPKQTLQSKKFIGLKRKN